MRSLLPYLEGARALQALFNFVDARFESGGLSFVVFRLAYSRDVHKMIATLGVSQFHREHWVHGEPGGIIHYDFGGTVGRMSGVNVARHQGSYAKPEVSRRMRIAHNARKEGQ